MAKILIVDDSATLRSIIVRVLRQVGLEVDDMLEAGNGIEVMTALGRAPDVGLTLSGVDMPQMNGLEFAKKVRETRSKEELPTVLTATQAGHSLVREALGDFLGLVRRAA